MMRSRLIFTLLGASAMSLALTTAGCGGPEAPITDPSKIPPLTAEQLETIRKNDQEVEQEEGGPFLRAKAKYAARTKRSARRN